VKVRLQSFFRFMSASFPGKCPIYELVMKHGGLQKWLGCGSYVYSFCHCMWKLRSQSFIDKPRGSPFSYIYKHTHMCIYTYL
jgi:hypothetical protein